MGIDNQMRRVLAHLATPRTRASLGQRLATDADLDAHGADVDALLDEALDNGWAVAITHDGSPADVVSAVESEKNAVGFGKGQAKRWETRAEAGLYDLSGGEVFMLSEDGLEELRGESTQDETDEEGE